MRRRMHVLSASGSRLESFPVIAQQNPDSRRSERYDPNVKAMMVLSFGSIAGQIAGRF